MAIRLSLRAAKAAIALLVALSGVTSVGLIAWSGWMDYRERLTASEALSQQAAWLVEEHMQRHAEALDQTLRRVTDRVGTKPLADLRRADWAAIRAIVTGAPHLARLSVLTADDKVVFDSKTFPAVAQDASRRDYRMAHVPGENGLFVGPLTKLAGDDSFSFTLSRPILRNGIQAGFVVAVVDAAFFQTFYESLGLGDEATCLVVRSDGRLVVRQQVREDDLGRSYADVPLFTQLLPKAPQGTYRQVAVVDGVERVYSYRTIPGLPLVAVAGVSLDTLLTDWRAEATRNAAGALTLVLIFAAAGSLAWTALRGEAAAHSAADQANDAKSRFLAAASHDLRQPFQAMRLYQDVLIGQLQGHSALPVAERLGEAMRAGEELLDNLLHLSTLDAGMVRVDLEPLHLTHITEQVVRECELQAQSKGIMLSSAPFDAVIVSDRVLLARILRNLVVNAIRYTSAGSVQLSCRRDGAEIIVEVADSGIGIDSDKLSLIFEDFYQVETPDRDRAQGMGMGLAIVARTARLLGHRVSVRSQPGEGSVFSVAVPLAEEAVTAAD